MQVTFAEALKIGTDWLRNKILVTTELRAFIFNSPELSREYPVCWVFASSSEQMREAGYVPAAVFVYIDKADGHVWTVTEQDAYFYAHEKKAQPERIAA